MQYKSKSQFAAAKWILGVGIALLLGMIALTRIIDKPKQGLADSPNANSNAARSERSDAKPTAPRIADEVPPWVAARQKQEPLPPGLVPASEINPPPPDPNAPLPPPPVEPPNPATHRP